MGYVVDELFAFIAIDDDGDEGVIAAEMGDFLMPLVFADMTRLPHFAAIAHKISQVTGDEYKLKHFQLLGDVSEEYLEQYRELPVAEPTSDDQRDPDEGERAPDSPGKGNGSGEIDS